MTETPLSRTHQPAGDAPTPGFPRPTDPVCGVSVDPALAAGSHPYQGKTYFFCSPRRDNERQFTILLRYRGDQR